jgi:hypothetical protein
MDCKSLADSDQGCIATIDILAAEQAELVQLMCRNGLYLEAPSMWVSGSRTLAALKKEKAQAIACLGSRYLRN